VVAVVVEELTTLQILLEEQVVLVEVVLVLPEPQRLYQEQQILAEAEAEADYALMDRMVRVALADQE
jgi:hypothetical protein